MVSEEGVHTYDLIVKDCSWTEAYNDCLARGGHLVRINSDEEYNAIMSKIKSEGKEDKIFWLGGSRNSGSYTYHWIYEDGTYGTEDLNTNAKYKKYWFDGEPSFTDSSVNADEYYMSFFYVERLGRWGWNDAPNEVLSYAKEYSGRIGYICEYE